MIPDPLLPRSIASAWQKELDDAELVFRLAAMGPPPPAPADTDDPPYDLDVVTAELRCAESLLAARERRRHDSDRRRAWRRGRLLSAIAVLLLALAIYMTATAGLT